MTAVFALTIRQPYASQIIDGVKVAEDRDWATSHRGLLLIHAGVVSEEPNFDGPRGVIIGSVHLVAVVDSTGPSRYRWLLDDPHPLPHVRCRGLPGLWPVPPDVLAAYRGMLSD